VNVCLDLHKRPIRASTPPSQWEGGEEGGLSLYKGNHRTKTHEQPPPVSHAAKTGIKKIPWKYANIILFSFYMLVLKSEKKI